ncbi:MAG TPA: MASE1 domain-containing protein [Gemmatimonadales bacterium]
MSASRWVERAPTLGVLAAAYFVAGRVGLELAYLHPSASPVWAPTGIAIAGLLLRGLWAAPAVLLAAYLVNVTTGAGLIGSAGIALGNTLEALLAAGLVARFAGGRQAFARAADVLHFALLAGAGSTTVSATIGVTTLALTGSAPWPDYGWIWFTWWLGDMMGAIMVTPAILLWSDAPRLRPAPARVVEGAVLLAGLAATGLLVFGSHGAAPAANPLTFLALPLLIWAALRFPSHIAVTGVIILSGLALWGTLWGIGPFVRPSRNESLLLLQGFMGVAALTTTTLAAAVAERRRAEDRLRAQAIEDPLTGLANYRRFTEMLEAELVRSGRTERPFAVLLYDLDGLKRINDRFGHLVGSEALRRVAAALRQSCRALDLAARFGGDEFAVILPETNEGAARALASRVALRLAGDGGYPPLSVSVGLAVHPGDGSTVEALLGAADQQLYAMKGTSAT